MKLTFNTESLKKTILACQSSIRGDQQTLSGEGSGKTIEVESGRVSFMNQSGRVWFDILNWATDSDSGTLEEWNTGSRKISFPIKQVLVACHACSNETIEFKIDESWARVTGGSSRMRIPWQPAHRDGELEAAESKNLGSKVINLGYLKKGLEAATIAQGRDDQAGWRLDAIEISASSEGIRVYSCDGNRIVYSKFPGSGKKSERMSAMIPKISTLGLVWFLRGIKDRKNVTVKFEENHLVFETPTCSLSLRTCVGKLPNVEKLFVEQPEKVYVGLDSEKLSPIVNRAVMFSQDGVTISLKICDESMDESWSLIIEGSCSNLGEYSETVEDVSVNAGWGDSLYELNVNGKIFGEFLKGCEEDGGVMELSEDENRPIFIRSKWEDVETLYIMTRRR
jgi:DNA polymerase III sliding clamp (beta) subunit (PCNA family)